MASDDETKGILAIVEAGWGVWVAQQGAATIRLIHATSHIVLTDLSLVNAVGRMLSGCDDIIRQHKTACLRVTAVMAVKDTLWVGTSAGVVVTLNLPHIPLWPRPRGSSTHVFPRALA